MTQGVFLSDSAPASKDCLIICLHTVAPPDRVGEQKPNHGGGGLKNLNSACDLFFRCDQDFVARLHVETRGRHGVDHRLGHSRAAQGACLQYPPPPSTQLALRSAVRPAVQTSRTYGPSRTPISKLVVPSLNRLLEVTFASRFLAAPINALAGEAWGRI